MKNSLVTIGVPVYNGEQFLVETLNSITAQTYPNIEIIISDNASSDNSFGIAKQFSCTDIRISLSQIQRNVGYSGNANNILSLANGKYIGIYHSDDIYSPKIVETEISFLEAHPECGGVFTLANCVDENGQRIDSELLVHKLGIQGEVVFDLDKYLQWMTSIGNVLICPSAMIRTDVYRQVGPYDESIRLIEDQDMWLRILEVSKLGIIGEPLMKYRIHKNQGSESYRKINRDHLAVSISALSQYLSRTPKWWYYQERLSLLIADDYIQIAKRNLLQFKLGKCKRYLQLADTALLGSFFEYMSYRKVVIFAMFSVSISRVFTKRLLGFWRSLPFLSKIGSNSQREFHE